MVIGGVQPIFSQGGNVIQSFDYIDIANATGSVLFDAKKTSLNAETKSFLFPSKDRTDIFSNFEMPTIPNRTTSATVTNSSFTKLIDVNFDSSEFQLPRNLKGEAYIRVPYYLQKGAAGTFYSYIIAKLRKWDGSTETEIGSTQSATVTTTANEEYTFTLPLTVPLTQIKKGEQLRLTIEIWAKNDAAAQHLVHLSHDPTDVSSTYFTEGNSRLVSAVPFRIEI